MRAIWFSHGGLLRCLGTGVYFVIYFLYCASYLYLLYYLFVLIVLFICYIFILFRHQGLQYISYGVSGIQHSNTTPTQSASIQPPPPPRSQSHPCLFYQSLWQTYLCRMPLRIKNLSLGRKHEQLAEHRRGMPFRHDLPAYQVSCTKSEREKYLQDE